MIRMVLENKGVDRLILISDSFVSYGDSPEHLRHIEDLVFDDNSLLSGSKLTLDIACRNALKHLGASVVDAFRFASYNPSRVIGLLDRGEIAVGKRADLVIVDHWMKVNKVIFKGELQ